MSAVRLGNMTCEMWSDVTQRNVSKSRLCLRFTIPGFWCRAFALVWAEVVQGCLTTQLKANSFMAVLNYRMINWCIGSVQQCNTNMYNQFLIMEPCWVLEFEGNWVWKVIAKSLNLFFLMNVGSLLTYHYRYNKLLQNTILAPSRHIN